MALFRHAPRSAAAVAVTEVELLVLRNERLEWLIRNRPELTLELLKHLSDQIVSMDGSGLAAPVRAPPMEQKKRSRWRARKEWWAGTGLNRRHQDFQTR